MTPDDRNAVAELITSTLLERLDGEVELVFRYGSHVHGGTHRYSDVDFSYVPRHPNTWESITVMVDDILFDLYPLQWETLERMAEHDDWRATILADLEITWAAGADARARINALVARHHELERPEARPEMVGKAIAAFERTGSDYYQLSRTVQAGAVDAARVHANRILQIVFHALVLLNRSRADTRKLGELLALERRPARLEELVDAVLRAADGPALLAACDAILADTRALVLREQCETQRVRPNYAERLGPAYPELKADLQRVILACEQGDLLGAQTKLYSFLHELHIHLAQGERGVEYGEFNSLDEYVHGPLAEESADLMRLAANGRFAELASAAERFDERVRVYFGEIGARLYCYGSAEALRVALSEGDSAAG